MALRFAHGSVLWLAADAAAVTYVVNTLGFTPKAIRFTWNGIGSATDAASATVHWRAGVGFATGPASRVCVGSQSQDAAGTQVCTTGHASDCVAMTLTSTPARDGALDLQSIDVGVGFTLIIDDATPVDISVQWEAWGVDGQDSMEAAILDIAEPAGTGAVSYEVGFPPSVVMFAGAQGTSLDTVARGDAAVMVGAASGPGAAENIVAVANDDDASPTSDTDRYALSGECLAMMTVGGGNPSARAQLTAWTMRGFTLNWIARATTNRRYIGLAIRGGIWRAGATTIEGNSASATATVAADKGVPFMPCGIQFMGCSLAASSAGTSSTEGKIGTGSAVSTSSRRALGVWSENGKATAAEIDVVVEYDACLAFPSNAGALAEAIDINAINADGFQLIVDTAGGVASEWIGYVMCGSRKAPHNIENWKGGATGASDSVGRQVL